MFEEGSDVIVRTFSAGVFAGISEQRGKRGVFKKRQQTLVLERSSI